MKKGPIYLNPKAYTLSALIIGYALIGDYTAYQQNAFGAWLMTVGQILECNSSIQQAIQEIKKGKYYNINSQEYKNGGSPYRNDIPFDDFISPDEQEIKDIKEMLEKILDHLNKM